MSFYTRVYWYKLPKSLIKKVGKGPHTLAHPRLAYANPPSKIFTFENSVINSPKFGAMELQKAIVISIISLFSEGDCNPVVVAFGVLTPGSPKSMILV